VGLITISLFLTTAANSNEQETHSNALLQPTYQLVATYTKVEMVTLIGIASVYLGDATLAFKSVFGIKVYTVSYTAKLAGNATPGDSDVTMSGLLMIPTRSDAADVTTVAFMHETTEPRLYPSDSFSNCSSATFLCIPSSNNAPLSVWGSIATASMGYVTIVPDGPGLGTAFDKQHMAYLISEGYAISAFNLFAAATSIAPTVLPDSSTMSKGLVVTGYSEGGYAAMAVHKESYADRWMDMEFYVAASYPSGGPYDLYGIQMERYVSDPATIEEPYFLAYLAYSYRTYLDVTTVFNAQLPLETVATWFNELDVATVDSEIRAFTASSPYGLLGIFNDSEIEAFKNDESSPFTSAVKANDLVDGGGDLPVWAPQDASFVHMCHGSADSIVFVENAEMAQSVMDMDSVTLKKLSSSTCSDHASCGVACLTNTLGNLWSAQDKQSNEFKIHLQVIVGVAVGVVILSMACLGLFLYRCKQRDEYYMIA